MLQKVVLLLPFVVCDLDPQIYPPLNEEVAKPSQAEVEAFKKFPERIGFCQRTVFEKKLTTKIDRGVHVKQHLCGLAKFEVFDNIPAQYKRGVFSKAKVFDAFYRLSNGNSFSKADKEKDLRGIAIKLLGVEGEKVLESEKDAETQDFLGITFKALPVDTAQEFLDFMEALATEKTMWYFLTHPIIAARFVSQLGDINSYQEQTFYSGSPFLLGSSVNGKKQQAMKYQMRPCEGQEVQPNLPKEDANYLSKEILRSLNEQPLCFDFYAQLQTSRDKTPVEVTHVEWTEENAPVQKIGQLVISHKPTEQVQEYCNNLSFNIWHAIEDHRPIGQLNRGRKLGYTASKSNWGARKEPTLDEIKELGWI